MVLLRAATAAPNAVTAAVAITSAASPATCALTRTRSPTASSDVTSSVPRSDCLPQQRRSYASVASRSATSTSSSGGPSRRPASPSSLAGPSSARPSTSPSSFSFRPSHRFFSSTARLGAASVKDPYATLGVKKDASAKDIKSAYYKLAKKYHPDTNKEKGSEARFVEIQNAYDILSDEKKKAAFDQYGTTDGSPGFDPFGSGSPYGGGGGFGGFGGGGFGGFAGGTGGASASDIFEGLFGGAFGGGARARGGAGFAGETRGSDLETTLNISFEEACRGTSRTVTITPVERCGTCSGDGLKPGARKSTCGACGGTGTRTFVIQSGFQMASTCPACGGSGSVTKKQDECGDCEGVGRVRARKTVEVRIPAGVDDGAKIRMDGAADAPLQGSGPAGSLYVRIGVRPSKVWRRQGSNLYFPATIPFHTAILGGKVRVPTLDGDVELRVPQGTQVGDELLLRGRGVPHLARRGDKGDLLVQFEVQIPRSLTKRQKEILQAYADEVEGRAKPAPAPSTPPSPPPASPSTSSPSSAAEPKAGAESPSSNASNASKQDASGTASASSGGDKAKNDATDAEARASASSTDAKPDSESTVKSEQPPPKTEAEGEVKEDKK